jgi:hypothetical protein
MLDVQEARHEFDIARSLGGDPTDEKNCCILCAWCHQQFTEKHLRIETLDPVEGANGDLRFTDMDGWSAVG